MSKVNKSRKTGQNNVTIILALTKEHDAKIDVAVKRFKRELLRCDDAGYVEISYNSTESRESSTPSPNRKGN